MTGPGTRTLAVEVLRGAAAGEPTPAAGLRILSGPGMGRLLPLPGAVTVGRAPGAEVRLADPAASRRHLTLAPVSSGVRAEDLSSKNGWTVNGRRAGRRRLLRDGDVVGIGALRLVLELRRREPEDADASAGAPAATWWATPRLAAILLLSLAAAAAALAWLAA